MPDGRIGPTSGDPGELAAQRETIRLAFVAALQHLPARQRAVLILREVLAWSAAEAAELLETTVPAVNSALQRARATLARLQPAATDPLDPLDDDQRALLARYVDAFERYDLDVLTALLHEEVVPTMPPFDLWLCGRGNLRAWYLGPGIGCRGSRLVPTAANGAPAFGQYRSAGDGSYRPWSLQVMDISDGIIVGFHAFLDTDRLFPLFDLAPRLEVGPAGSESLVEPGEGDELAQPRRRALDAHHAPPRWTVSTRRTRRSMVARSGSTSPSP